MREIKFKGIRKDNGEWIYGSLLLMNGSAYIHENFGGLNDVDFGYSFTEVIPESVCEFTGLHDKNGKEIYEGDILNVSADEFDSGADTVTVDFIEGGFVVEYEFGDFELTTIGWAISHWQSNGQTCEVIGNIHQNPELCH